MKISPMLILAFVLASLGGCSGVTKPYDLLDAGVKTADGGAVLATTAVQDGVPASPYGYDALTGLRAVVTAEPIAEAAATLTAAKILDAAAVTLAQLHTDYAKLTSDVMSLNLACVNQAVAAIEVQHKAVLAAKAKK